MEGYKKSNPHSSYLKAGVLLAVIVVLFIVTDRLSKGKMPGMDLANLQSGLAKMNKMQLYEDAKKDSVRKAVSGLWMTAPTETTVTRAITVDDRIELKDNGIIWQVKSYRVVLPSGDTTRFTYVMTGYLMPFGQRLTADSTAFSDLRIIYQVMVKDNDTCYGESDVTGGWSHLPKPASDSSMKFDEVRYQRYSGEIAKFFPEGITKLVKKISMSPCPAEFSFYSAFRTQIAEQYSKILAQTRDTAQIRSIVQDYYSVLMKQAVNSQFSIGDIEKTRDITISFVVKSDGSVADTKVIKKTPGVLQIERFVASTALLWKFPPVKAGNDAKMIYQHHQ